MEPPAPSRIPFIPQYQTAAILPSSGPSPTAKLEIRHDVAVPQPGANEVLVKLQCSGICHSDVHALIGESPLETDILGHEGVGIVVAFGPDTEVSPATAPSEAPAAAASSLLGARVGISWAYSVCSTCEICAVNTTGCPHQRNAGRNVRGTFAQYITAPAQFVTPLPSDLGSKPEQLAPLLCAGLSMYSSITKAGLRAGEWLVLPGAGGGLGHLGVQIAARKGLKVIAIDTGHAKREMCLGLGAAAFLDFKVDNVQEAVLNLTNGYGAHSVVVGVGSTEAYVHAFKLLRRFGTLVCVGLPKGDFHLPVSPLEMVVRCLKVVGSSCGTKTEMRELLDMVRKGEVEAHVQTFELAEINEVVKKLASYEIGGRAVLRIP